MLRALVDPRTPGAACRAARGPRPGHRRARLLDRRLRQRLARRSRGSRTRSAGSATGGGFATRELYTDFDEALFDALRPSILTGIADYIVKDDLLDRAVQVTLVHDPRERGASPEKALWAAFEAARPMLLGALLDDVSAALKTLPSVRLTGCPGWPTSRSGPWPPSAGAGSRHSS